MGKITDIVRELAVPLIEKNGCELWDVEYVKEAGNWFLRVYIDSPGGVSVDSCENVSRGLDPLLDEYENLIPGSYIFEVSSAGAERRLRGPSDFERFAGRLVEVKLYKSLEGHKSFLGKLADWDENFVVIDIGGERRRLEKAVIAEVRLRLGGELQ